MSQKDESFSGEEAMMKEWELSMEQEGYRPLPNTNLYQSLNPLITPPTTNTNTSGSSENSSHCEKQNLAGLAKKPRSYVSAIKARDSTSVNIDSISTVLNDIHNDYTKRRFKHVQSKVGQYIEAIKAEDQKRRSAHFKRYSSMPTNLTAFKCHENVDCDQQHKGYSSNDIFTLNESSSGYVDINGMTSSAYSNIHGGGASSSSGGATSNSTSHHESIEIGSNCIDFIDKQTYAQLIEEKEKLQISLEEKRNECLQLEIRLDEKRKECTRHKRNVDYLRIELTDCQDNLKRLKTSTGNLNLRSTNDFYSYSYGVNGYSTECNTVTKETQTDFPMVQTVVNLRTPKSVRRSDSGLRQRLNSNSSSQIFQAENNNRQCYSNKSSININNNNTEDASPKSLSSTGFTYVDREYAPIPTLNDSTGSNDFNDLNSCDVGKNTNLQTVNHHHNHYNHRRQRSLRQRLVRFFGRCTRCDDPNQSSSPYGQTNNEQNIEMIHSPMPLLARAHEISN